MSKELFVVLGMHRSGTSLVSAGISSLGINFGTKLMGESASNRKGHWEDTDIVGLNNRLFTLLNINWDHLEALPIGWQKLPEALKLRDEAVLVIQQKLASTKRSFCIKDPRIVRLLPFWTDVFKQAKIQPNFIFVFRSPIDVMKSLLKRDRKPLLEGQLLWLHHNVNYLSELEGYSPFFIEFNEFVADSKNQLMQIARHFSIQYGESELESFAHDFLDKSLINSQTNSYNLSVDGNVFTFSHDIFRNLSLITSPGNALHDELYGLQRKWLASSDIACQVHKLGVVNENKLKVRIKELAEQSSNEVREPVKADLAHFHNVEINKDQTEDLPLKFNEFKSDLNSMLNQERYLQKVHSEQLEVNFDELSVETSENSNSLRLLNEQVSTIKKTILSHSEQDSAILNEILCISSELCKNDFSMNNLIKDKVYLSEDLLAQKKLVAHLNHQNEKLRQKSNNLSNNVARFKQEREHIRASLFWRVGKFFRLLS